MINPFQGPENLPHFPSGSTLTILGLGRGDAMRLNRTPENPSFNASLLDCLPCCGVPVTQEREREEASQHLMNWHIVSWSLVPSRLC